MNNDDQKVTLHVKADISDVRQKLDQVRSELKNLTSGTAASNYRQEASSGKSLMNTGANSGAEFNASIQKLSQIVNSLPDKLAHLVDEFHHIRNGETNNSYEEGLRAQAEAHRAVYGQRLGQAQSVLRQAGYDTQGNKIDSRGDFQSERRQAGFAYNDIRKQAYNVNRSNAGIGRTVLNASTDGRISYERYNRIGQDYQRNQTSTGYIQQQIEDYQHNIDNSRQDYTNRASVAYAAGDTQASKQYTQQAEYFRTLGEKLDNLSSTLDKSNREAEDSMDQARSGVESGSIQEAAPRGSFASMVQSRGFAIGMNMVNTVQNGVSSLYNSGTQARLGMQDSINGMTLGSVGNGGRITPYADNRLTSQLAHLGINNGTGYSATDMANFAGNYEQSSGNTNLNQDVKAAGDISQLARFSGIGSSNANQLVSTLGLAGAIPNDHSLRSVTGQFQGMLANTNTSGQSVQQSQALATLISNQYNNGNRVSTSDASRLVALQGLSSHYGFSGQQGAQQINNMSNSISSKGFQNPAMRFAWMNTDPQRYAGTVGQAQQALDMNNPLSANNAGHLSGMIQNLKMTQGHGNDTLTAEYLMQNMGISGQYARQLTEMSDRGQLNPSSLRKLEQQNRRSGSSTNRHQRKQFEAQGNSTLDIQVAVKQNGEIATSESMDSLRRAQNSATSGLPGIANAGLSLGGSIISSIANVGATGLAMKGLGALGSHSGMLGKVGRFGSSALETGAGLFGFGGLGGKTASATDEAESAVREGSSHGGLFTRLFRNGKGKLSEAADFGKGKLSSLFRMSGKATDGDGAFLDDAGKLAKFGGKGNIALQAALSLPEYYNDVKSKHPVKNTVKTTGGLAGGIAGAGYGAEFGAAAGTAIAPGIGTAVGGIIGGIGGGIIGSVGGRAITSGITDLFSGKSKKKRQKGSKGSDDAGYTYNHAEHVIKDATKWLHDFNVALDTAQRIVRQAENKSTGNGGKSGGGSSTGGDDNIKGSKSEYKNASAIASYLKNHVKGATNNGIAGLLSNWSFESGLNPSAVNPDGNASGLGQWYAGRDIALRNYAKEKGVSWKNLGLQLDYALNKDSSSSMLKEYLRSNDSPTSIAAGISNNYERGGYLSQHVATANKWKEYLASQKHANGGIFNNEQAGIIAEDGPEAVVPLSFSKRYQASSILNTVSGMMGNSLSTAARSTNNNSSYNFSPNNTVQVKVQGGENGQHYTALKQQLAQVQQQLFLQQQRSFLNKRSEYYSN